MAYRNSQGPLGKKTEKSETRSEIVAYGCIEGDLKYKDVCIIY